jgi:hypothetical protein
MSGLYADLELLPQAVPLRKANVEDLFGCDVDDIPKQYNENHHNDDSIQKNQRNYGHRKRIKP